MIRKILKAGSVFMAISGITVLLPFAAQGEMLPATANTATASAAVSTATGAQGDAAGVGLAQGQSITSTLSNGQILTLKRDGQTYLGKVLDQGKEIKTFDITFNKNGNATIKVSQNGKTKTKNVSAHTANKLLQKLQKTASTPSSNLAQ